jgi:hypothetical protein
MQHRKSVSILASSSLTAGALNRSTDGSSFKVSMNDAIIIPSDAQNITVEVVKATIWHTTPNFKSTNNQIHIKGLDTADVLQTRVITLPVGLYDVASFKSALLAQLLNEGFKQTPTPVLDITADYATNKLGIVLNYTSTEFSFTVANGVNNPMNQILGYDIATYTTTTAPFVKIAPNIAKFNQLNSILIVSNLCDNGFAVNSTESNIVAQVLIDVSAGSQIIYEPFNATSVSASNLQGRFLKEFEVRITDENLDSIDTNGEEFTVLFKISFTV